MGAKRPPFLPLAAIPYQRDVAAALTRALARGRLAHAYLFAGPRGVGKEMVAYGLGAAALCPEKPLAGCGVCNTCRRVFTGTHPDFIRYEAEGAHFDVEKVREILVEAGRPPSESPRKVLLVVEPEKMTYRNDVPANAFLKTLEEPPGRATFILLSHDPRQLLPTIVSRCVAVRFPRLTLAELSAALIRDYGLEAAAAAAAAERGEGTLAGALAAASEEYAETVARARELWAELAAGGVPVALTAAGAFRDRDDALALVASLAELTHDLAMGKAAGGGLPADRDPVRTWEALARAARALRDNGNVVLTLEELFLALAA